MESGCYSTERVPRPISTTGERLRDCLLVGIDAGADLFHLVGHGSGCRTALRRARGTMASRSNAPHHVVAEQVARGAERVERQLGRCRIPPSRPRAPNGPPQRAPRGTACRAWPGRRLTSVAARCPRCMTARMRSAFTVHVLTMPVMTVRHWSSVCAASRAPSLSSCRSLL